MMPARQFCWSSLDCRIFRCFFTTKFLFPARLSWLNSPAMISYLDLLRHVLEHGKFKADRTGTGTFSVFGAQIRCPLRDSFPLLTTKKVHTKSIFYELLWFLRGDSSSLAPGVRCDQRSDGHQGLPAHAGQVHDLSSHRSAA